MYQVSNLGRVKSLGNNYKKREKIMKPQLTKKGYLRLTLNKRGKIKRYRIHRLVAEAFIPNPENKKQVNHIDKNKQNNEVNNLEWVTCRENIQHALNNKMYNSLPKVGRINLIKWQEKNRYTDTYVAEKLGISRSHYNFIKLGKREPNLAMARKLQEEFKVKNVFELLEDFTDEE